MREFDVVINAQKGKDLWAVRFPSGGGTGKLPCSLGIALPGCVNNRSEASGLADSDRLGKCSYPGGDGGALLKQGGNPTNVLGCAGLARRS